MTANGRRFTSGIVLCGILAGGAVGSCAPPAPPIPPPARSSIEAALAKAGPMKDPVRPIQIILLADKKDHGAEAHDYPMWQERWALLLGGKAASNAGQLNLFGPAIPDAAANAGAENTTVHCAQAWPTEEQFASADVIVSFCYLAWSDPRKEQIRRYLDRGGGLVLIHSATWTKPKADPGVAALVGVGGFTRFRHGPVRLEITDPGNPICQGVPPQITLLDESYWPPTPPIAAGRVTVLAVSQEEDAATKSPSPQPMFWTAETGRGRVFGCIPGHFTWTFDDPWFRTLILRGMAWAAGEPVHRFDPLILRSARVSDD